MCSYHLATERVKRKGGGESARVRGGARGYTWRARFGEKNYSRWASSNGNEIKYCERARAGEERAPSEPRESSPRGLLSRVPSAFGPGCNLIFDNTLIRRIPRPADAFGVTTDGNVAPEMTETPNQETPRLRENARCKTVRVCALDLDSR